MSNMAIIVVVAMSNMAIIVVVAMSNLVIIVVVAMSYLYEVMFRVLEPISVFDAHDIQLT
jgi:hypothetical protein